MSLWDNLFTGKSKEDFLDYSSLLVDIHSHLIPGIDDGSSSVEESLEILRGFRTLGFRKMIITPHVLADYYRNTPVMIQAGLKSLQQAVLLEGIDIQLEAAAEYMLDDGFEEIGKHTSWITFGNKMILIELSTFTPHPNFKSILFDLRIAGYQVILAHAERYSFWYNDIRYFEDLKDREVLLQVNLLSFSGLYSAAIQKMAQKLADLELIDFLGSDVHNLQSLPYYFKSLDNKYIQKLLASNKLLNANLL